MNFCHFMFFSTDWTSVKRCSIWRVTLKRTIKAAFTIATANNIMQHGVHNSLRLQQEINMFSFLWKLARCCKVLQPIAIHETVKWAWISIRGLQYNTRSIFKFVVMSWIYNVFYKWIEIIFRTSLGSIHVIAVVDKTVSPTTPFIPDAFRTARNYNPKK